MNEPRRLNVTFTVFTDEESGSIGARVAAALDVEDMDFDYLAVTPFRDPPDNDMLHGRIKAAKWDAFLAMKPTMSEERRAVYITSIHQQLTAALAMMEEDDRV